MQKCPHCGAETPVFFSFISQSSHHWYCSQCDRPLTFSNSKNLHGLFVLLIAMLIVYFLIKMFYLPAFSVLFAGVPLLISLDYVRYRAVNYVEPDQSS